MEIAIFQFVLGAEEQVFKELFKELVRGMNAFLQIVIVGTDESIAKIPGVYGKHIVVHSKAKGLQVLHDEDRSRTRVALAEGMDLPDS